MIKIPLAEQEQVVKDLYMGFIRHLDVGLKWTYENHDTKNPSITFSPMSTTTKIKEYLGGSYMAELPFFIAYRVNAKDTNGYFTATKLLNDIAGTFEQESIEEFPNLKLTEATPISIEMDTSPSQEGDVLNDVAVYIATYKLIYKKKGRYN